jgi:hypothetical protein
MDTPETLAILGTQYTGRRHSRETGNIGHTRHRAKTLQRNWQHWAHKTQGEDTPETLATLSTQDTGRRQSRETGNIGYTRQRQAKQKTQQNMCWTSLHVNKHK